MQKLPLKVRHFFSWASLIRDGTVSVAPGYSIHSTRTSDSKIRSTQSFVLISAGDYGKFFIQVGSVIATSDYRDLLVFFLRCEHIENWVVDQVPVIEAFAGLVAPRMRQPH
jgi:hypothetical protein